MNVIQQDFKGSSKILFIISLISIFVMASGLYEQNYSSIVRILFNILAGGGALFMILWATYIFSYVYEIKQNQIIAGPLFGLFGKNIYYFKDLKKVEYSISPRGLMDHIYLHFENGKKHKLSINNVQVNSGKLKLFLYAHVSNLEEIAVDKYRRLG
jgi:hypothetical protein